MMPDGLSASPHGEADFSSRQFAAGMVLIVLLAAALRLIYPTADPPWRTPVGVTWHDEGAWVHNARNKALFGVWSTDAWNPVFIAPVFSGLEYLSFRAFGVGLRQARLVSEIAGLLAVLALGLGVRRTSNRAAGLMAAAMLATNYVYVMFDRAALMESSMTAALVLAWWCYARSADRPMMGFFSGAFAMTAFFTKASAACFVLALAAEAMLVLSRLVSDPSPASEAAAHARRRAAAFCVLAGLAAGILVALVVFVGPRWSEYRFYNWQVSIVRKPSYTLRAILDRASWFPIIHDFFTRLWLVTLLAICAAFASIQRFARLRPAERVLLLWLGLAVAELVLHDDGNERRFVLLIPPLVALASLVLGHTRRLLTADLAEVPLRRALLWGPALLFALYTVFGAVGRLPWLYQVRPGVQFSALIALLATGVTYLTWPRLPRWLSREQWSVRAGVLVALLVTAGNVMQYIQWASDRTYKNYDASVALGHWLPPGTLVHGKLSNGLALENRIHPIFVGRGFGNYDDRTSRDDIRYLLTYISPRIGYEGPVIADVLDAYPGWRIVRTFDVAETAGGNDRAALIDKHPEARGDRFTDGTIRAHH